MEWQVACSQQVLQRAKLKDCAVNMAALHNLPVDSVPGTVHLVDVDHNMHTRHAGSSGDIVLVPTPSNDPEDPLNWSPKRKLMNTISVSVYGSLPSPLVCVRLIAH